MEQSTSANSQVKFWPQYYRLLDHDSMVSVIRIDGNEGFSEVTYLCEQACAECDHFLPGPCLRIERATLQEWLDTH